MVQEKCRYFKCKEVIYESRSITGNRNPVKPHTEYQCWCEHPKSPRPKDGIGPGVQCEGDLNKCPIKDKL